MQATGERDHQEVRDVDYLKMLAGRDGAHVAISLTTLDAGLAAKLEPRASSPVDRLRAIRELSRAGVPVSVMTAPVIPGLNDEETRSYRICSKQPRDLGRRQRATSFFVCLTRSRNSSWIG